MDVPPHLPHSPDLALSYLHIFGSLKYIFSGKRVVSDDEVTEEVTACTKIKLDR
jgi:hypothetical protein